MSRSISRIGVALLGSYAASAFALPSATDMKTRQRTTARSTAPDPPRVASAPPVEATVSRGDAPIVVLDAGHGGFDRGGIAGQRVAEKIVALDVAQRVRSVLAANGYRVIMTRDSDVFVPLGARIGLANSYRNAIFVCIHFNAARRRGANGIETYFYSRDSLPLASAIHYYVAGSAPSANRGVRRRGFYVLRRANVPAVLVECGFLTNPTEAQYAQTSSYRQQLAEQIARGVRAAGSTRVASASSVPLQPFIDQTRVRDPDISGSRHSKRRSHSKSRHKKSRQASESTSKKKSLED